MKTGECMDRNVNVVKPTTAETKRRIEQYVRDHAKGVQAFRMRTLPSQHKV